MREASPAPAGATGRASASADVYLHIGLPKTGTTYLQQVLWDSRRELAAAGVLVPGEARMDQSFAVWDLLGRRPRDADQPGVAGSWDALVNSALTWNGSSVVVSEELLAAASPRQVARAVRAFAPARVHVVVTVRDLARVVLAAWQQELLKGRTWSLDDYVAAVRDPGAGSATAGVSFWLRQDVARVLDVWERVVPREHVHLVTVPPTHALPQTLLERFAEATRLPAGCLQADHAGANVSVGVAEAEVLRRLNQRLEGSLNERQYVKVVKRGVHPRLQARHAARVAFPDEHRSWVCDASRATLQSLRDRGHAVSGDLDDLLPTLSVEPAGPPTRAQERDVADAALDALASVVNQYAESWWKNRRGERAPSAQGLRGVASSRRARGYRARLVVLGLADRNRAVRWFLLRRVRHAQQGRPPAPAGD